MGILSIKYEAVFGLDPIIVKVDGISLEVRKDTLEELQLPAGSYQVEIRAKYGFTISHAKVVIGENDEKRFLSIRSGLIAYLRLFLLIAVISVFILYCNHIVDGLVLNVALLSVVLLNLFISFVWKTPFKTVLI